MNIQEQLKAINGLTFGDCVNFFAEPDGCPYVKAAREIYHRDGEVEVDDRSVLSQSTDDGDYVMAWVWVSNEEAGIESEGNDGP